MAATSSSLGPRAEHAYRQLRRRIECGEFGVGLRLPPQRALCQELAVSLVTVNRVIARLAEEGLVQSRQGAGVYVRPVRRGARAAQIAYMYMDEHESLTPVQHGALVRGYLLSGFSQCQGQWQPQAERLFLQRVKEQHHHALLAFCSPIEPTNDELLEELAASGVRVLHVEHYRTTPPAQPYLLPDFTRAGYLAAQGLLRAGYGPLYFLAQLPPRELQAPFSVLAWRGFAAALAESGAAWSPDSCWAYFPDDRHLAALPRLAASLPPGAGVVGITSHYADTLLDALRAAGRDVPGEVGVVGLDVGSPFRPPPRADMLSFDRPRLLERALDLVAAPAWAAPRELVAPRWLSLGTVREPRLSPHPPTAGVRP